MEIKNKTILFHPLEFELHGIKSIGMSLDSEWPCLVIKHLGGTNKMPCRNANTVGCLICNIGTFLNSTYYTHMSIKSILHPDKSHVVQFIVETW